MTGTPKQSRRSRREPKSRLGLWTALALGVLLVAFVALLTYMRPAVDGDTLTFTEFIDLANAGQIDDAEVLDEDAYIVGRYVTDDGSVAAYNTPLVRGTQRDILEILAKNRVPTSIEQQAGKRIAQLGAILLPGLILVVLFVYLILSWRRGTGLFGLDSGARTIEAGESSVTFADVAGQDAAVAELKELTDFLADPERFTALGAVPPKGVLLYGPPGCGKTLLARALAGEAGASFYSISGSDFVELYVGVGAARVRDLFTRARANAPALVFIDELDSVGRARGAGGGGAAAAVHSEQEQALNQILAEMDGFSPSEGLIVVAATNRPDILDPALLRPGRFDRSVGLERPDEAARLAILSLHARVKRLADDVDLAAIARRAIGLTGADLASVANEGALLAARSGKPAISQAELQDALQRILEAPERQRRLSQRDRSVGRRFTGEERVTFADIAGMDEAAAELAEVREYLCDPDRFAALGARVPRGILLSGPPGCGKTLLARAVAGEANAAFFSVAASEFVEVYVGRGAARVRDLFAEARATAPAIVFLDEIDAVGGRRGGSGDGPGEREQTLNQILTELDGFEPASAVIVVAATNRPDILDSALVRPGRFDRHVAIGLPDRAGRRAILDLHAAGKRLADDVDLDVVAGLTRGFAGADLAGVLNEAALLAARAGLAEVPMRLVEEGVERASLGLASGVLLTDDERRTTAYHEAGHGLVARALPGATPPHKLTILPRGGSLGHCRVLDDVDRMVRSRSMLLDQMAVALGGRVAEELVFGEPATGASSDLERVGAVARAMVCGEAMGERVGLLALVGVEDQHGGRGYSQETGRALETEMCRLMEEAQDRAQGALTAAGAGLDRVAEALLTRETLTAADLDQLAMEAPVEDSPQEEGGQPLSRPAP